MTGYVVQAVHGYLQHRNQKQTFLTIQTMANVFNGIKTVLLSADLLV